MIGAWPLWIIEFALILRERVGSFGRRIFIEKWRIRQSWRIGIVNRLERMINLKKFYKKWFLSPFFTCKHLSKVITWSCCMVLLSVSSEHSVTFPTQKSVTILHLEHLQYLMLNMPSVQKKLCLRHLEPKNVVRQLNLVMLNILGSPNFGPY
jgi:hypothetical protein